MQWVYVVETPLPSLSNHSIGSTEENFRNTRTLFIRRRRRRFEYINRYLWSWNWMTCGLFSSQLQTAVHPKWVHHWSIDLNTRLAVPYGVDVWWPQSISRCQITSITSIRPNQKGLVQLCYSILCWIVEFSSSSRRHVAPFLVRVICVFQTYIVGALVSVQ